MRSSYLSAKNSLSATYESDEMSVSLVSVQLQALGFLLDLWKDLFGLRYVLI